MKALITDTEIREPHLERQMLGAAGFEVSVAQCDFAHDDVRNTTVTIAAPKLDGPVNRMRPTDGCEPWTFGTTELMDNLAQRRVLRAAPALLPA